MDHLLEENWDWHQWHGDLYSLFFFWDLFWLGWRLCVWESWSWSSFKDEEDCHHLWHQQLQQEDHVTWQPTQDLLLINSIIMKEMMMAKNVSRRDLLPPDSFADWQGLQTVMTSVPYKKTLAMNADWLYQQPGMNLLPVRTEGSPTTQMIMGHRRDLQTLFLPLLRYIIRVISLSWQVVLLHL